MSRRRSHPGAWLLLIVFSLNAVAPVGAGRWFLCVGCDDVGLTLTRSDSALPDSPDSCCATADTPGEDQRPARPPASESLSACDCVQVPVESQRLAAAPAPVYSGEIAIALIGAMATEDTPLVLASGSINARGPPDAWWIPSTQTLLGQHTSLII